MFRLPFRLFCSAHQRANSARFSARYINTKGSMTRFTKPPQPAEPSPSQSSREPVSEPRSVTTPLPQKLRTKGSQKDVDDISESIQNLNVTIFKNNNPSTSSPKSNNTTTPKNRKKNRKMDDKEPKVFPSPASGGVPVASIDYINSAHQTAQRLEVPQHLLVVIDLNGTILFRPSRKNPHKFVARPHALRFLQYCIDTFHVVIWSSARPENVSALTDAILPPSLKARCIAIWGRDRFALTPYDYSRRVICYKRLNTIWSDPVIARSHPEYQYGAGWDQTNTVLVDDSVEKGQSEPYNLVLIPEYEGDAREKGDILPQVHDYLNQLSLHSNVSAYMRAVPFKAQAQAQGPPVQMAIGGQENTPPSWVSANTHR